MFFFGIDGSGGGGLAGPFPPAAKNHYWMNLSGAAPLAGGAINISRALGMPINLNGITGIAWDAEVRVGGASDYNNVPLPALALSGSYQILLDTIVIASGTWADASTGGGLVDFAEPQWYLYGQTGGLVGIYQFATVTQGSIIGSFTHNGPVPNVATVDVNVYILRSL